MRHTICALETGVQACARPIWGLLDVLGPALVVLDRIHAEADELHVALVELRLEPGDVAELGGADRREVLGMREQHGPAIADPVMELELPLGGLRGEIGCGDRKSTRLNSSH